MIRWGRGAFFLPRNLITGNYELTQRPATFLFITAEGGQGILQIISSARDPNGTRIRYRLIEDTESGTQQKKPVPGIYAPPIPEIGTFGPIIERVVRSTTAKSDSALDLDTGNLIALPEKLQCPSVSEEFRAWMKDSGSDVVAVSL